MEIAKIRKLQLAPGQLLEAGARSPLVNFRTPTTKKIGIRNQPGSSKTPHLS